MGFWRITKDCLVATGRAVSTMTAVLEEFNKEQDGIEPFKIIKRQWLEYLHATKIAIIVIPESYESTLEIINSASKVSQKIIDLMNATIEEPEQRDSVLQIINEYHEVLNVKREDLQKQVDEIMKEMYSSGLSESASLSNKIRYVLDSGSKQEAEKTMSEHLPSVQEACLQFDALFNRLGDAGIKLS